MGKEEITSAKYRHKCHSIFTLKKMLKAIKHAVSETEHAMGVWCPTCLLHKVKEILEGPKYETAFHTVFRAACRWTVGKGSKHLDPWMLAITNKEPFTAEVHHYRSCYHTYWVRSVTSWVVNLKPCMRQQQCNPAKNSLQTSKTNSNPQVLLMTNTVSWLISYVLPRYQFSQWLSQ